MQDNFKAPLGKLPPFSSFQVDENALWKVSLNQDNPDLVHCVSVNLAGISQSADFPADKEVEVIRLARPMKSINR